MQDILYKTILDNITIPVCLFDNTDNILYSNLPFKDLFVNENPKTLADIKKFNYEYQIKLLDDKRLLIFETNTKSYQDFLSTVSHELRTPLTSIRGFADTMLLSSDKLSPEQQKKFLSIIRNQADRLTRLVENLLKVSKISRKDNLIFKEINLNKFIIPIIELIEKKYPTHNFSLLQTDNLPDIWADNDALEQIFMNLLDNAAKYSSENSKVIIRAEFLNNEISIKIIDEAVKIPQNQLEKIFNKFSRIDNPLTRNTEGSGLGLFITKSLVENIGGSINAENYENGNIFVLKLQPVSIEKQLMQKLSGVKNER